MGNVLKTCPNTGVLLSSVNLNNPDGACGVPCTTSGYTGTAGKCICESGYSGTVTYTNGVLGGCAPLTCLYLNSSTYNSILKTYNTCANPKIINCIPNTNKSYPFSLYFKIPYSNKIEYKSCSFNLKISDTTNKVYLLKTLLYEDTTNLVKTTFVDYEITDNTFKIILPTNMMMSVNLGILRLLYYNSNLTTTFSITLSNFLYSQIN